jgi:hypothetical protein
MDAEVEAVARTDGADALSAEASADAAARAETARAEAARAEVAMAEAVRAEAARAEAVTNELAAEIARRGLVRRDNVVIGRYSGVAWDAVRQMWRAQIEDGGSRQHIGLFGTEGEAKAACAARRLQLGLDADTVRSSDFRGVSWDKPGSKWQAKINFDGKKKFLGVFEATARGEVDAALAYDAAARAAGWPERANFEATESAGRLDERAVGADAAAEAAGAAGVAATAEAGATETAAEAEEAEATEIEAAKAEAATAEAVVAAAAAAPVAVDAAGAAEPEAAEMAAAGAEAAVQAESEDTVAGKEEEVLPEEAVAAAGCEGAAAGREVAGEAGQDLQCAAVNPLDVEETPAGAEAAVEEKGVPSAAARGPTRPLTMHLGPVDLRCMRRGAGSARGAPTRTRTSHA